MDIYKCPKSIFENTFGNQKTSFLYILTIFLLKDNFSRSYGKVVQKASLIASLESFADNLHIL
jgi:hypothetical protein